MISFAARLSSRVSSFLKTLPGFDAELSRLRKERDLLLADNDLFRKHAAKQISDATLMTGMAVGQGSIDVGLQGGAAGILAEAFVKQFKEGGGVNYLELKFESSESMPGEAFVVTLQRVKGETPAQQLKAARAQADELRSKLDWIYRQSDEFSCGVIADRPGDGNVFVHGMGGAYGEGKTFAEALDAATAKQVHGAQK